MNNNNSNLPLWLHQYEKREERKKTVEVMAINLGILVFYLLFIFQFSVGAFRDLALAPTITLTLIILFLSYLSLLIIYPKFNFVIWPKIVKKINVKIFNLINIMLLSIFYLLNLPFAHFFGRKKYLKLRPSHSPWILGEGVNWRTTTWQKKEVRVTLSGKKGFLRSIFYIFLQERNSFMLISLIVLLFISMFILFAQSSAVAPFIYSIF